MPLCTGRVLERATTLGQAALYNSNDYNLREARCATVDTPTNAALHHWERCMCQGLCTTLGRCRSCHNNTSGAREENWSCLRAPLQTRWPERVGAKETTLGLCLSTGRGGRLQTRGRAVTAQCATASPSRAACSSTLRWPPERAAMYFVLARPLLSNKSDVGEMGVRHPPASQ